MIEINKIYNEHCQLTMARMPDKFVNLTITSPPYNMNLRISGGRYVSRQIVKELSTKYTDFDDNLPIDDFYELHKGILSELIRVSNIVFYNIQIVTGSKRAFFKLIGHFSDQLKEIIVWDKVNGEPAMQFGVLNRQTELILVFDYENAISRMFKDASFDRGTLSDCWQIKRGKKKNKSHGAVFPEQLVKKIIDNFSVEGNLIYDPFNGTGTTAFVSKVNNRNYIGSEISKDYCDYTEQRLQILL